MAYQPLQTERLLLRDLRDTDLDALHHLRSNAEVNAFIGREMPVDLAETARFIADRRAEADNAHAYYWVIALHTHPDTLIGTVCFWNVEPEKARTEIGYQILPEYQRRGYMREALRAVLLFGFQSVGFNSVLAFVKKENLPSIQLLEQQEFVLDVHTTEAQEADADGYAVYFLVKT